MAMVNKILDAGKAVGSVLLEPNDPAQRGLTGLFIPKLSKVGLGIGIAAPMAMSLGATFLSASNRAAVGRVTYQPGLARMVGGTNTGAVEAMKRASQGDYGVFSEMAEKVVSNGSFTSFIDDYGASPALISALYNMGG